MRYVPKSDEVAQIVCTVKIIHTCLQVNRSLEEESYPVCSTNIGSAFLSHDPLPVVM